ncbi:probable G-protein coupled receptor 139 [Saccostrea cucullata]|uniref:probable G-protein coupled receptor 139 n=1 Tax=Saccostrea cuccullata TaxID=36930 RepID=UPI002ED66620
MKTTQSIYDAVLQHMQQSNFSFNFTLSWPPQEQDEYPSIYKTGRTFYAYFTPVILIVGFIGNSLSFNVFMSKGMRNLSASVYLAALSATDLVTLLCYVMVEWFRRGLVYLQPEWKVSFVDTDYLCQFQMYTSYVSRMSSVWLVVAFTVERYIGVCHPLRRIDICTVSSARRIVICIFVTSLTLVLYKPFMTGVFISGNGNKYCTTYPKYNLESFILDSVYGLLITIIPFTIISVMNFLIINKLFARKRKQKKTRILSEEALVRLEFTSILFVISFCFVVFNIPFLIMWIRNFFHSKHISNQINESSYKVDYWRGVLYITRTIFYANYCINFFLYSLTGAYFRRGLKALFCRKSDGLLRSHSVLTRYNSHSHTNQSWV